MNNLPRLFADAHRPRRRGDRMNRRDFITLLGGAAAWPLAARAQQPAMPVIGYFSNRSLETEAYLLQFFRKGLAESGYVIDQNATIELRFSEGRDDLLPRLAADLVRREISVLVATIRLRRWPRKLQPRLFRSYSPAGGIP